MLHRRLFRALVAFAALVALAGALAPAVAGVVSPRYRVWRAVPIESAIYDAFHHDRWRWGNYGGNDLVARPNLGPDPWGRPWADLDGVVVSRGPNGLDERGAGDDVTVDGAMEYVAIAPWVTCWIALVALWLALCARSLGGPRGPEAWHDMVRAAAATSPFALLMGLVMAAVGLTWTPISSETGLAVPFPVAVAGAAWLVAALGVLAWRVRQGNPRRRTVRPLRVAAAVVAAGVAAIASAHGLATHNDALRVQAQLGRREQVEAVLTGDLQELEAYLARGPHVEWQRLDDHAHAGVARLGPRALPYLARGLRWDGGVAGRHVFAWRELLDHDVELRVLAAALAAEPGRYPLLLLDHPELSAALVGQARTLEGLASLERSQARWQSVYAPGLTADEAAETSARAREVARALRERGGEDAWVVVDVMGLTPLEAQIACATSLDGGPERTWRAAAGDQRIMAVVGPLPATSAGRLLRVRDLAGRVHSLALPAVPAGTTVWVDAKMRSGSLVARTIARPQ